MTETDERKRFLYWTMIALCAIVGSLAPNLWIAIGGVAIAFSIGFLAVCIGHFFETTGHSKT